MLKILFWSNEKWRDEAPNRLVRRLEPAGGHFIPSQMAAHDANSGSGPTRMIRCAPGVPLTPEDARRLIEYYVEHYNTVRLHSAIGFVTPADMLAGRQNEIHGARDRKLEQARQQRQLRRRQAV